MADKETPLIDLAPAARAATRERRKTTLLVTLILALVIGGALLYGLLQLRDSAESNRRTLRILEENRKQGAKLIDRFFGTLQEGQEQGRRDHVKMLRLLQDCINRDVCVLTLSETDSPEQTSEPSDNDGNPNPKPSHSPSPRPSHSPSPRPTRSPKPKDCDVEIDGVVCFDVPPIPPFTVLFALLGGS